MKKAIPIGLVLAALGIFWYLAPGKGGQPDFPFLQDCLFVDKKAQTLPTSDRTVYTFKVLGDPEKLRAHLDQTLTNSQGWRQTLLAKGAATYVKSGRKDKRIVSTTVYLHKGPLTATPEGTDRDVWFVSVLEAR